MNLAAPADAPVLIPELQDLLGVDIPEGQNGIISDGANNSVSEACHVLDTRYSKVEEKDLSLPVKRARMVLRKSALAASPTMMEREVLREVIEEDHERWAGCIMLPVSVLFFVLYVLSAVTHEDLTFTYISNLPMKANLEEKVGDVMTIDDVWPFVQDTYLPFFFKQYDGLGNPMPREEWSSIGQYSHLLGSVWMELQRSKVEASCGDLAEYIKCFPVDTLTGESYGASLSSLPPPTAGLSGQPWSLQGQWEWWDSNASASASPGSILGCADEGFTSAGCASSGRRLIAVREEIKTKMPPADFSQKYMFQLDSRQEFAQLYNRIEYLKERKWLDAQSSVLQMKALVLNSQMADVPRVILTKVTFFFSRGGGVYSEFKVEGKTLVLFLSFSSYVVDFIFVVLLLVRSVSVAVQIFKAARARQLRSLANATFAFSFLSVGFSWINFGLFGIVASMQSDVTKRLQAFYADPSTAVERDLIETAESMMSFIAKNFRPCVAFGNILFLCQIIISLQWQPRLAVVTQTLLASSSDLFHYLIVCLLTVSAFALSGMVIFGRRVIDFADAFGAMGLCFKVAIESEYDWATLSAREWWTSFLWVFLYLMLIVMLIVNMVLAIIMDVYAEVRMHSGDSMTVFEHLQYIYRKFYHRHQWVPDDQLLDQVIEMPQHVTLFEVRQAFPEMHHFQLQYLQNQCRNKASRISRVGLNKNYISQIVAAILYGLEEIQLNLGRLRARGWMGKGIEVGNNEGREWVKDIFSSIAVQSHWMNLAAKHISTLQLRVQGVTVEEEDARRRQQRQTAGRFVKNGAS